MRRDGLVAYLALTAGFALGLCASSDAGVVRWAIALVIVAVFLHTYLRGSAR